MNKLMVQVVGNFSHERLNHLKKVVRYLRPVAARPQQPTSIKEKGRVDHNHGVRIATGAATGGVAGGIIAGIAGGSVIIGAVVGAVILGTVVAVVTKKE
jgi:hypothetical protein